MPVTVPTTADPAPSPTFTMPLPTALSVPSNENPELPERALLELLGGELTATTWVCPVSAPKRPPTSSVRYVTVGAGFAVGFVAGFAAGGPIRAPFWPNDCTSAAVLGLLVRLAGFVAAFATGFTTGFVGAGFNNTELVVPGFCVSKAVRLGIAFGAVAVLGLLLAVLEVALAFAAAAFSSFASAAACAPATAACSEAELTAMLIFSTPAGGLLVAESACRSSGVGSLYTLTSSKGLRQQTVTIQGATPAKRSGT